MNFNFISELFRLARWRVIREMKCQGRRFFRRTETSVQVTGKIEKKIIWAYFEV